MENKRNFQRELEKVLDNIKSAEKIPVLLLHSCCGPCSSYVLEYLTQYFYVKLFFYNPNIHPCEEYFRRLEAQHKVVEKMGLESRVEIIEGEYNPEDFFSTVSGLEGQPEGGKRCEVCIRMRMEEAAKAAVKYHADYFATTLTVSPHKNAPYINLAGEKISKEYNIPYLVSDFKKKNGYKRSIELCRIYDIYRQNYCGCVFSMPQNRL
ncbi:epoxyqueuosine reductase QueH [Porcipelethomonas sp.]|uniref:epoxyqueuosine reductase QueH n=1 Tax=Porcipelethomonas sp. TaxID=2981675 RepID=UPI003EF11602